jgi:hypothetical protein
MCDESGTTPVLSGERNLSGSPRLKPGPKPMAREIACATCGRAKPDGRRECGTCRSARYRAAHPDEDRAAKRAYKERQAAFADQMKRTGR